MKSMQAVIAVILVAQMAAAAQVEAVWKKYKGPDGAFTIEMPARPSYEKDVQTSAAGTPYTVHTYSAALNKAVTFSASVKTYPADMDVSDPEKMFKAILAADKEFFTGGEWKGTWMKYQGFPAIESTGTNAGIVSRTRFVIRGQQMFIVKYFAMDGEAPAADVDRFMESLIIL
ncbi:MAG: hypothetical protein PHS14_01035 [Elusimicrobia bacterium]|nr:hypothetical protein [Elusimicrobiota bacterium]